MQNELEIAKLVWGVTQTQQQNWDRLKVHTSRKEKEAQAA
jgi:hypothetical protein